MPQKATRTKTRPQESTPFWPDGGQPTWEVAYLFPPQGAWTEDDYFSLESLCGDRPLVELSNGRLEVLPVPTQLHQLIMLYFFKLLEGFAAAHAPGMVLVSGMRVRLRKGKYRDPDVFYMKAEHAYRRHEKHWDGADLVMEVVSPDPKDRRRDLVVKRREYARAGIPEYWIIDPEERCILVLTLQDKTYQVHGQFLPGTEATSVLLPGFAVAVEAALSPPGSKPSA